MGEPNPSNKIKYLRYIGLIGPRIIKFQIFMTFSNKYNFDAVLSNLFKGYLKNQNVFQFIIKVTVTLTPHESCSLIRNVGGRPAGPGGDNSHSSAANSNLNFWAKVPEAKIRGFQKGFQ